MFTVVRTTTNLSLDEHFLKNPAATFFVKVEGDGMEESGIFKGDTLIIDRFYEGCTGVTQVVAMSARCR